MTAAVAAQLISKAIGFKSDETFIASLLQDIGIATLAVLRKEDYLAVLDEKSVSKLPVIAVEQQIFGFDHQDVGSELLKLWGLPESVYLPIRYHHEIEKAPPELRQLCSILWASDRLSAIYHGSGISKNIRNAKEILTTRFGFKETQAEALIDAVADKSDELLSQFGADRTRLMPFSEILQQANSELSRMNMSYDMLLLEYQESARQAEKMASALKSANEKLRHAAFHDSLTGLYNRQYFKEAIEREILRSDRYRHPLSLVLLDLDRFKTVNDTYGHHCGDVVLKTVGQMIVNGTRRSDIVVRYGGEEFAILLPETALANAVTKAEACRALIGATQMEADGHRVRLTISAGVASWNPSHPVTADELIKAADQALYLSKRQGRNRITVWDWDAATAPIHP